MTIGIFFSFRSILVSKHHQCPFTLPTAHSTVILYFLVVESFLGAAEVASKWFCEPWEQGVSWIHQNHYWHFNSTSGNPLVGKECPWLKLSEQSCVLKDVGVMVSVTSAQLCMDNLYFFHLQLNMEKVKNTSPNGLTIQHFLALFEIPNLSFAS